MRFPCGSASLIENRRHRALRLLDEGLSLNEVGRRIDVRPVPFCRSDRRADQGLRGLKVRKSPGRPCKLTPAQSKS